MEEVWKPVRGFEGLYEVSNCGRVISHHKYGGIDNRIMKFKTDKDGYLCVKLCNNGNHKHCHVHRLVAEAFVDNPNDYPMVNHKDEDKKNNHVDNIEWCDAKYNNTYGHRLEKAFPKSWEKWSYTEKGKEHMRAVGKKNAKKCAAYKDKILVKEFNSAREAAKYFGVHDSAVSYCCTHEKGKCKGLSWRYV